MDGAGKREKARGLASDGIQTAIDTMHNNDLKVHSITHECMGELALLLLVPIPSRMSSRRGGVETAIAPAKDVGTRRYSTDQQKRKRFPRAIRGRSASCPRSSSFLTADTMQAIRARVRPRKHARGRWQSIYGCDRVA